MPQPAIGCDLSRATIDFYRLPVGHPGQIANAPDAIVARIDTLERDVLIVSEATRGCDGDLIAALAARGHPFSHLNPRQAREFARAAGLLCVAGAIQLQFQRCDIASCSDRRRRASRPLPGPLAARRRETRRMVRPP